METTSEKEEHGILNVVPELGKLYLIKGKRRQRGIGVLLLHSSGDDGKVCLLLIGIDKV